jgi:glucose-6-phosphate isomerase
MLMCPDGDPPVSIDQEKVTEYISQSSSCITRRGKDMVGVYAGDVDPDIIIYEVYELESVGKIKLAITKLMVGKVGNEYFMTKGHYHEDEQAGEVYFGLRGHGLLLMQTKDGETGEIELEPGTIACIPPGWAHRSVNTGDEDFVFLAAYPGDAGHDYSAIERAGFRKRVVETDGLPTVVDAGL